MSNSNFRITKTKGALLSCALLYLVTFGLSVPVQSAGKLKSVSLQRFKSEKDPWKILDDPQIKKEITRLMGHKEEDFWNCTQSSNLKAQAQDLLINSMVNGLAEDRLSFVELNFAKNEIIAGYLIDSKFHVFGAKNENELPASVKDFIASQTTDLKNPQTLFEHADWSAKPRAMSRPSKKLDLTSLTGTYERPESRFTSGTLKVLALPNSKIKISVFAMSGGRTGEAEGEVPIVNNIAELRNISFPDGKSKIVLKFDKGNVSISGNDFDFCGAGVTLVGDYEKTDDKPPVFR